VLLPDCRTQTVTYTADPYNGFTADVTYAGEICEPKVSLAYEQPETPAYGK